jgi:signal transduction histidine kinase
MDRQRDWLASHRTGRGLNSVIVHDTPAFSPSPLDDLLASVRAIREHLQLMLATAGPSLALLQIGETVEALQVQVRALELGDATTDTSEKDAAPGYALPAPELPALRAALSKEELSRRLAHELESSLGHLLANAIVELEYAAPLMDSDPAAVRSGMLQLQREMQRGAEELRQLVVDLQAPLLLTEIGLGPSVARYAHGWAERAGVRLECASVDQLAERLPSLIELSAFRAVQAALKSAGRRAGITQVRLTAELHAQLLHVGVEDDGAPIGHGELDQAAREDDLARFLDILERLRGVGGSLTVACREGWNRVVVTVPCLPAGSDRG